MPRLLTLPTRHPVGVLALTLALTAVAAAGLVDPRSGAVRLEVDASVDRILPDDDPARVFSDRMARRFGARETLVVALVADDVFTPDRLAAVARVSERLQAIEGVRRVASLATALDIRSRDGDLEIEPFLAELPRTRTAAELVRESALRNPLTAGSLVSPDSRATAVLVELAVVSDRDFVEGGLDLAIAAAAREAAGGDLEVLFTGPAHIKAATTRLVFESLGRILPLAFALMAAIGLVFYRSLVAVVVPIAVMATAIVWTLSLPAWLGASLNLVTAIVPPLLLVIGFAYAIHLVAGFHLARERDPGEVAAAGGAAAWSLRHAGLPVAVAGVTTIAGFLALTVSPFRAVREFGLLSMAGIAFSVLLSLTAVPAALQLFGRGGDRRPRAGGDAGLQRRIDALLARLARFDVRHRRAILIAGAGVALLSLGGMTRIRVNSDLVSNFEPDHPVRRDFEAINDALEGANPISVVLSADDADAFVQPDHLRRVEALQAWLDAQPEVGGSTSVVDYVKLLHRTLRDDDPEAFAVPDRARLVKQLLFFGTSDELASVVDTRRETTRLQVRARTVDSAGTAELVERLESRLAELPGELHGEVTGNSVLLVRAMDDIAESQIETLAVAFAIIYGVLVLLFTSWRVGLLALLPNVLPVLFYFGALGATGVGLNTTTGLFGCMILGVAVDDTIHLLTTFNAQAREHADEREGAVRALRLVGRPVTITTIGLCLGFLALATSDLKNQAEFGALGALTLAFAWLVDVTVTPALCAGMRVVTLWDALTLDLGRDPQHSIPLLRGLSKTQARIAALMTSVVEIPAGERVIRSGESGDDLFVVIEGELAASVEGRNGRVALARARRGDVMGEVGLYTRERTADVDAVTATRALRLTRENLERLRRRYPRIGAVVFWNLSEILAGRLASLTRKVA